MYISKAHESLSFCFLWNLCFGLMIPYFWFFSPEGWWRWWAHPDENCVHSLWTTPLSKTQVLNLPILETSDRHSHVGFIGIQNSESYCISFKYGTLGCLWYLFMLNFPFLLLTVHGHKVVMGLLPIISTVLLFLHWPFF